MIAIIVSFQVAVEVLPHAPLDRGGHLDTKSVSAKRPIPHACLAFLEIQGMAEADQFAEVAQLVEHRFL